FQNRSRQQAVFQEPIFDLAFFPRERGPYNFNTNLVDNGLLPAATVTENWGAITTAIRQEVDFDKANIEYIEFWMLDPFINGANGVVMDGVFNTNNNTGGRLIFQLGSISEDIIPDGKHGFENGLPSNGDLSTGVTETPWGYVTNQQYVVNAFDNSATARANQDVGFDGAPNTVEVIKFQDFLNALQPGAQQIALQ